MKTLFDKVKLEKYTIARKFGAGSGLAGGQRGKSERTSAHLTRLHDSAGLRQVTRKLTSSDWLPRERTLSTVHQPKVETSDA